MSQRKRKAVAPPASAPQPARAAKKAATAAIAGGSVPPEEREARVEAMVAARTFWDSVATEHLRAWATDYDTPEARKLTRASRDRLLEFLVDTEGVQIPAGPREQQQAELQKCWRKRHQKSGVAPEVFVAAAAPSSPTPAERSPAAAAAAARGRYTPPLNQEAPNFDEQSEEEEELAAHAAAYDALMKPAAPSAAAFVPSFSPASPPAARGAMPLPAARACAVCAAVTGVAPLIGAFMCTMCHFRGDIGFDHPVNAHARELALAAAQGTGAPAAAASSAAASSSASSQSSDTSLKALSALDLSLIRMLHHGSAVSLFSSADAAEGLSHKEAVARVARAYDSAKYQQPSEHLIALIRAGKLRDIGYALPRPHQSVPGKDDAESGSLSLSGNTVSFVNKVPQAPSVQSAQQLSMALFSTILPALIDRPKALAEWLTLGRTALALEATYGWSAAAQYLQRQLALTIDAGVAFATEVNSHVLLPIIMSSAPPRHPQGAGIPSGQQRNGGGGGGGNSSAAREQVCYNWNNGVACKNGADCRFAHQCQGCGSRDHKGPACPKGAVGNGGKRAPGSGSSIASRSTHRQSTASTSSSAVAPTQA